jgi:hypothetical protein
MNYSMPANKFRRQFRQLEIGMKGAHPLMLLWHP